jgi:AraC family transcriptional regulator
MDHRVQVARARRFLRSHVGDDVQLATVARAAGASMFHLARLYRALTGDTVGRALTRMRIERAAHRLAESSNRSISAIALEVGFRTPSSLNKAFRAALDMSPTAFRSASPAARRTALRTLEVAPPDEPAYTLAKPRIERAGAMRVVYVREQGAYSGVSGPLAWATLEVRIAATPLVACQRVAASYDDPDTVASDSLRYDAGVIVGPDVVAPPGTQLATWPGGTFAVFDYRGDYRFIADAFREIFATHRPPKRRDAPCVELYRNDPSATQIDALLTELWIPIHERSRHA